MQHQRDRIQHQRELNRIMQHQVVFSRGGHTVVYGYLEQDETSEQFKVIIYVYLYIYTY